MASGSSSGAQHYGPRWVDAPTSAVIAIIFVAVVIAISLSFAVQLILEKTDGRPGQTRHPRPIQLAATHTQDPVRRHVA